jgi:hypothetical protein
MVTDLDLVVIEPFSGEILLCQLKHQDPYGADLAARKERTSRLKQQTEKWISAVRAWLAGVELQDLRSTLRLPKNIPMPKIRLLILTRHFAHVLRQFMQDSDVYCANWNQLVNAAHLVSEEAREKANLEEVLTRLRSIAQPAREEEFLPEPPSEWKVGNLRFSITQLAQ